MANEELINFILKSRERGRTDEQITRALISVGWQKDRVSAAFGKITQMKAEGVSQQEAPAERTPIQPEKQPLPSSPMQAQPQPAAQMAQQQAPAQFSQPPIGAAPAKKPLFSLPKLFAKKGAQPAQAQDASPAEKKPLFTVPNLFAKKEQAQLAQMPSQQPVAQQPAVQMAQPPVQPMQAAQSAQQMAKPQRPPAWPMQPPSQRQQTAQPPGQVQSVQQKAPPAQQAAMQQDPGPSAPFSQQQPIPVQAPDLQQGQISPISGIMRYLRIFTSNKVLVLAAALVLLAIVILAAYFLVFAKSPAVIAAAASPPPFRPPIRQPVSQPGAIPEPPLENKSNATAAQIPAPPPAQEQNNSSAQSQPPAPPSKPSQVPVVIVPNDSKANNSTGQQPLVRFAKFTSTKAYALEKFCPLQDNGTLARVHYKEYFGGECTSEKQGVEGFANTTFVLANCFMLPCCIDGPSSEYSRSYDWFECGYAQ